MTAAAIVAGLCTAAGCGSAASAARPAGNPAPVTAQPANPVPIVRQAGAKVPAGEVLGDHDVYGDRMADGKFPGTHGESVTVYTTADMRQLLSLPDAKPDDSHAVIAGKGFDVMVYAGTRWPIDSMNPTYVYPVRPAVIAQRVHGRVLAG